MHDQYMWWCGNDDDNENEPVGMKGGNAFGLYDMHGNVWEWVHDYWRARLGYGPQTDPIGQPSGSFRVIRGGDWDNNAKHCRSAHRNSHVPLFRFGDVGFRLARFE